MWVQEEEEIRLIQIEEVIKQNEKSDQKQFKTRRVQKKRISMMDTFADIPGETGTYCWCER